MKYAHLINGSWIEGGETFQAESLSGTARDFPKGTADLIASACEAAETAFSSYAQLSRRDRAAFVERIAVEIEARGDALTEMAGDETGLPVARLEGERGRTTGQLRLFAQLIEETDFLDIRHDPALPDRTPLPRSDLKVIQIPIGPVGVFGASNFPLAFSVAGGDTASALAAGCPVVVKGHPAHPGTSQIIAEAIHSAINASDVHPGAFSLVHGPEIETGQALAQHPLIQAIGFTGSLRAGKALFDTCAQRSVPIPFFGELGSINPMFVMPNAANARAEAIANGWAASLTMGAGQFCTNPGVCVALTEHADAISNAAVASLSAVDSQTMLTSAISDAYNRGSAGLQDAQGVETLVAPSPSNRAAKPTLFKVEAETWLNTPDLWHEVFGPTGIIVTANSLTEFSAIASKLDGQLTATLHLDDDDAQEALPLLHILQRKAGRVLANGYPTGVEVCDAMVHGGPYPASTNFGHTSVGTSAIRRWLRPVCFQDMPTNLLPEELRNDR